MDEFERPKTLTIKLQVVPQELDQANDRGGLRGQVFDGTPVIL